MIIAVSGKARAGKDLLASIAAPHGFKKLAFADPLKERVRKDFGLSLEQTDGALKEAVTNYQKPPYGLDDMYHTRYWTPREIMIEYGQFFRQFDKNFWVNQVINTICKENTLVQLATFKESNYIITDCRFPNEIEALRNIGSFTVRLERHSDRDNLVSDATKSNISETALDDYKEWDFKLDAENNKTPEDLKRFFSLVLDQIGRKV